ncbi:hypothetical protein [Azorhizobium sp. AG788]|uniref:hypothetical protein n=1 Tax=Azorhizobium sp. AG788 TaxID=2183897 RepID=UPI003138EC32
MSDQSQGAVAAYHEAAVAKDAARVAMIRTHPAFPQAMALAARNLVEAYDGNRLLNRILNDRERSVFALMAIYLHSTPDAAGRGLTAGRIIDLCRETGLCSRGRAKAMLVLMRWAGYVEPSQDPVSIADRRQRPLVPTDLFRSMQTARWRSQFEAISLMDACGAAALARLESNAFRTLLIRALMARFRSGARVLDHAPALQLFAARDGGMLIVFQLLLSAPPGDTFPPEQVITVPVAELGRRFHVSRAHVLKLLRDAETAGLIERLPGPPGGVRMLKPLRESLAGFFAAVFLALSEAATDALAGEGEGSETPQNISPLPVVTRHPRKP